MLHCELAHGLCQCDVEARVNRLYKQAHICCAPELRTRVQFRPADDLKVKKVEFVENTLHLQGVPDDSFPQLPFLFCSVSGGIED
jgi:hypothetical protein